MVCKGYCHTVAQHIDLELECVATVLLNLRKSVMNDVTLQD